MSDPRLVEVRRCSRDVSWRTTWDFIEIVTSDGSVGVGEWSDAGPWQLAHPFMDAQASRFVGLPLESAMAQVAADAEEAGRRDPRFAGRRRLELTVLGALDAALCDLAAQRAGVSVAGWLAPEEHRGAGDGRWNGGVPCYGNINRAVHDRTIDTVVQVAKEALAAGFTRLKFAPFDFLVGARRVSAGLELAAAVRDAVGAEAELMLDLHNQLSVEEILTVGDALGGLGLRWLEDVGHLHDVEAHRRVRDELGIPLAAGEFAASPEELRPLLDAGAVDVVMPDVKHAGGPRRALELARFAEGFGVEVSPHNPTGPVSSAHTAALCEAVSSPGLLELAVLESDGRPALVEPREATTGGAYVTRPGPGLGVGLDPSAVWSNVHRIR
ncbi:mandelate racemase/muconate lactonizing enzyme family protein [Jiangella asiatica]|uniref:glucarate dehydratase n=1 Tax=Jiangella asiatica TaxID=2530372 RepID=A0A4V2Z312_9ACTN|nr:mandelate racemase/muconate lactonizing enzyme family protein [Jiangella asiatica]TDE10948.1 mandelate racemase/muconate lactonizing enzyme family protein [Jiangella asiatica]